MAELRRLRRVAVGRSTKHKITTKTKMVLTEILQFGYEVFVDAVYEQPQQSNGAVRKIRQRRKSGVPPRYNPELQFDKLLKEAKQATFNIFDNEIGFGDLDFDL
jgi:hypothetical protein